MLLDRPLSWRKRGRSQAVNQAQDGGEQASRDIDLGKLKSDIAAVADNRGTDFDQLLSQRGQRLVLYILRYGRLLLWVKSRSPAWASECPLLGVKRKSISGD